MVSNNDQKTQVNRDLSVYPLLSATVESIPLRGLEGVPGLPGAPQVEAGLTRQIVEE